MQEDLREENVSPLNSSNISGSRTKKMRLDNSLDFSNCFLQGKRTSTHAFMIHYLENDLEYGRLGIRIAKKKIKKAVERNRIKRIAREVFRNGNFNGIDMVLVLRNEKKFEYEKCYEQINEIFKTLKSL
jgi:ribonuclease P protein component